MNFEDQHRYQPTASCRDRGRGGADVGALCLSCWPNESEAGGEAREADPDEDRHKAPSHPSIRPLSLQDGEMPMTALDCQWSLSALYDGSF